MDLCMRASEAAGSSSGRTPFGQLNISHALNEVKPGEYWCVRKDGEDWPVVICDEEIVQKFFKGEPRPANARRSDGTWAKESASHKCYPAVVPGTLKLCWPGSKALEIFDAGMGKAIEESTTNPLLAKAWDEAILFKEKAVDIDYWKRRLIAKEKARVSANGENEGNSPEGRQLESRKRKGTPKFRFPPGYAREEADDDEGGDLFLPPADDATGPKIKNEFSDSTSSAEIDAIYDDPDPPNPRRAESSKRNKLDIAGRFSIRPQIPVTNDGRSRLGTPMAPHRPGLTNSRDTMTPLNPRSTPSLLATNADKVMIYVGNPHKKFRARRSGLDASPLLSSLATYHPQNGWYLMSPLLSSLDANDFFPVGQYLERGEYNPNILDEGTEWVRLEDGLTDQQRGQEVVRCGTIYSLAQTLELPGLQDLAFRKLKALAKQEPYHPFAILCVIDVVFEGGDEDLRGYLVQYLADHYWDMVLAETAKVAEVMQANNELSEGVFRLLSGVAPLKWTDAKIEEEHEVKDERKEDSRNDANPVLTMATSSKRTFQAATNDEGKAEPGLEVKAEGKTDLGWEQRADPGLKAQASSALDQTTESELVLTEEEKEWMREDDEAATKEVMTKMTQQQSQV